MLQQVEGVGKSLRAVVIHMIDVGGCHTRASARVLERPCNTMHVSAQGCVGVPLVLRTSIPKGVGAPLQNYTRQYLMGVGAPQQYYARRSPRLRGALAVLRTSVPKGAGMHL